MAKRLRSLATRCADIRRIKTDEPPSNDNDLPERRLRSTNRWKECSKSIRRCNPLCADPLGHHAKDGRPVPSEEVHHIEPLAKRPDLAFDGSNLIALCRKCHEAVERHGMPKK